MQSKNQKTIKLPTGLWVSSLYFIEGLPYTLVNNVSVTIFKSMAVSNSQIGLFTSLLYLPWMLKFFWAPFVNLIGTLRTWIICLQIILSALLLLMSLTFLGKPSFYVSSLIFALVALASATYDIACDGYYLAALNKDKQALYVGLRNTAYKMAWIFGSGGLVYLAGIFSAPAINWMIAFLVASLVFLLAAIFHFFFLSELGSAHSSLTNQPLTTNFKAAFVSFFQQKNIVLILLWILTFRAGDAMLLKMAQPFLLDTQIKGGLALSVSDIGLIYGNVGMFSLLLGGIAGSWLVFKFGLKKCLMPTAIGQSLTLLLYWLLAVYKPGLIGVGMANAFEQFIYGLASTAYTSYLFTIVKEKFSTSHYAIATGFMAIGVMLPGMISGYLADGVGYQNFFLISFFCSFPSIIFTTKLPIRTYNECS